jgi:ferritin-like metal-binding protein YciE
MASVASLREHLVEELNDLLSAEHQLIEALPKMQQNASRRELKAAFKSHLGETKGHARRVEQALKALGEEPAEKTCEAMKGLLEEGEELMGSSDGGALRDAMMITAAQKVEHYEIATYGTVRTYAEILGEKAVAKLMAQTLKEEKAADKKLTTIAVGSVNGQAATEWHEQSSAGEMIQKSAEWIGSTVGDAVKNVKNLMPQSAAADRSKKGTGGGGSRSAKGGSTKGGSAKGGKRGRSASRGR